jgi:PAS domain S-box-containing protein
MRIRTTVKLATVIIISVVLIYTVFAGVIDRTVAGKFRDLRTASGLSAIFDELRNLTTDYVLYRTDRAHQQWWTVHGELLERLNLPEYQAFQKEYLTHDLDGHLKLMAQAFTKLTEVVGKTALSASEAEANRELRNRLITQIMLINREISINLNKLSENISGDVVTLQRQDTLLDYIALFFLIVFIVANSAFLSKSVVQPVLQLHEDAEIIGRGNLEHRVATDGSGEIRELSQAFNEMTTNLMKVTVSRDELAKEVKERQQAQEALRESEERFRAFMDNSPTVAWAKDEAGRYIYFSKTFEDRFGVRLADWQGKTDFELWPQDLAEEFRQNDLAVLKAGHAMDVTELTRNLDGGLCYWWTFKFPFLDSAGVKYVGGIAVDITERQQAQAEIERLASFPRLNPNPILEVDFAGNITYANPAAQESLKKFGLQENVSVFLPKDMAAILKEASETGKREFIREMAIGKAFYTLFISFPAGLKSARIYPIDITQRKRAEDALRQAHQELEQRVQERTKELRLAVEQMQMEVEERLQAEDALSKSEERFRAMVTASSDVVYRMSPDWSEMLQLSGRDFIPDTVASNQTWLQKYIPPDDQPQVLARINEAVRTKSIFELEHRARRMDGSLGWTFSRAVPLLDENGEILEWFGAASDVTERHQAEEALRESEQRLRYLASQIMTAQELERKRISMDLHEGLGQSMTALKMYLRAIQRNLPTEAVEIREDFEGSQNLLKAMVEEVRRISRGLTPAILENLGLTAAIKHLLVEFSKYEKVEIKVNVDDIGNLFSPQTEINLFRIFQECLNNIAKHAHASKVSLTIANQDGKVYFSVKDNGVGIDLEQLPVKELTDKGMGLAAMEERLRMIGAQMNISSQKGTGTEISFSIPIDADCLIRG